MSELHMHRTDEPSPTALTEKKHRPLTKLLKASTTFAMAFGGILIIGSLLATLLLHRPAGSRHTVQVVDLSLVNSASPAVSPLIYGTNLAMDNSNDQFLSNAGGAPALQGLHAQLIRMPIRDQLTTADYTTALTKIKQIGATPLIIVHGAAYSGGDPYPKDSALLSLVKSIFPNQTVYVDFGNEEDLGGASVQTYVSGTFGWNNVVPKLKALTGPNFHYGGPVNFQYNRSYIDTFIATANPAPDYIVWHAYAGSCGKNLGTGVPDSQAHMLASVDNWGAHIQEIANDFATQNNGLHKGEPIIIDEWNYASDIPESPAPCYSNDQNFMTTFFNKAFAMFIANGKNGVIGTAEYEAFMGQRESMLDGNNTPTYQGLAFKNSYEANIGNLPPPPPPPSYSCSSLHATVNPANPMDYTLNAAAQVDSSVVLNSGDLNFGDGVSKTNIAPSGTTISANHTYAATGTFTATAVLHFTVNNASVSATCSTQVVVSNSSASYNGSLSSSQDPADPMKFQLTGRATVSGGPTFTGADIDFGDGKNANGLTPAAGGTSVQASHTYAASGTYTAKATFRFQVSGAIKTTTATTQVDVSGTSGGNTIIAKDTFARPNQAFWGTSSDGHPWGADASNNAIFSIKNNVGIIANTSNSVTGLLGSQLSNSQVVFTGRISAFHWSNFGGVLRYKDANDWYKVYLDGNSIVIQKRLNGTYATLKDTSFKADANTNYSVRFQAVGTTLSAKAWRANSSEPADWNVTVSDSSLASGYDGLRALPQAGNVVGYYYFREYQL